MKLITILLLFSLFALLKGTDSTKMAFKYSKVITIPDLSFTKKVYSGLDIAEQLDFKLIKNKKIGVLTNRTAINRNGDHLIDILKDFPSIKVHIIFEPEYGLFGIDDKRTKLIGREQVLRLDQPSLGAEDFAELLQDVPGTMFRLGVAGMKGCAPLHNGLFCPDESSLVVGIQVLTKTLLAWIEEY